MLENELKTKAFVVWSIATYRLALPLEAVLRVIKYPQVSNSELDKMGLIQLENYVVKIIDLYQYIGIEKLHYSLADQPILLITSSPNRKLYGILTCEPPTLMSFSSDMMQTLPKANHQPRLLDIVSYVVTNQDEGAGAVFLLDMRRVLETVFKEQF